MKFLVAALLLVLLVVAPSRADEAGNLIINPTFSKAPDPETSAGSEKLGGGAYILKIPVGSRDVVGWTIESGTVFIAAVSKTTKLIELADRATISQVITTVPGKEYVVKFDMFANSDPPAVKDVRVSAGTTAQTFVHNGNVRAEAYQEHELRFKAQSARTKISVTTSLSGNGHHAPAIGHLYVVPYDPLQASMQKDIEKA